MIQVPVVARQMLEVPDDLARVRVERQRRVGIEERAVLDTARQLRVRDGWRGPPEYEVQLGVIAPGSPERAPFSLVERHAVPGRIRRVSGSSDRVGAP